MELSNVDTKDSLLNPSHIMYDMFVLKPFFLPTYCMLHAAAATVNTPSARLASYALRASLYRVAWAQATSGQS